MTPSEANKLMAELTAQEPKTLDEFKVLLARGVEINRHGGDYVGDTFGYWLSENNEFLAQLVEN